MTLEPGNVRRQQTRVVRREELGELIRVRRRQERLTLEQAAQQCGISSATLWRLERQEDDKSGKRLPEPDTGTLGAVTRWLGVSLDRVLDTPVSPAADSITHGQDETTPDIIEAHLRADRKLEPQAAAALGRMFRLAYEQFQQMGNAPSAQVQRDDNNE